MEVWIDAYGFPSYEVSNRGSIRNKNTGHILRQTADRYGYLRVSLGTTNNVYIHKLICSSFYGPPQYPRNQINHIDCDRQNNNILNLEYCTQSENIRWGIYKGSIDPMEGLKKAIDFNHKPVKIIELNKTFSSVKECADFLNVKPTNVSRCLVGSRKGQKLHGYQIEYV